MPLVSLPWRADQATFDSGASGWNPTRRRAFANDLGYAGSLIAVSASSNRSKSDQDPAEWLPPLQQPWCGFATDWITVNVRWAAMLYDLLLPYAGQVAGQGIVWTGGVAHYLGLLAATLGDLAEAETHFAEARAIHRPMDAPTWLARPRLEWARMLLARRHPGDEEQARKLLSQAVETARELGLANVERRAVGLLT